MPREIPVHNRAKGKAALLRIDLLENSLNSSFEFSNVPRILCPKYPIISAHFQIPAKFSKIISPISLQLVAYLNSNFTNSEGILFNHDDRSFDARTQCAAWVLPIVSRVPSLRISWRRSLMNWRFCFSFNASDTLSSNRSSKALHFAS